MGGRASDPCRASDRDEIGLWIVEHDRFKDSAVVERCWALLNPEERCRAEEFRDAAARHAHLVTRASLRLVLAKSCGVDPQRICFQHNPFGRPCLPDALAGQRALDFNLSHDGPVTVIALARGKTVGVDVVALPCRARFLKIAQRFFSQQESASLHALPQDRQAARFSDLWALKEAYVKARGEGLSRRFDSFAFDLERPGRIGFAPSFDPIHQVSSGQPTVPDVLHTGWHFSLYRHFSGLVIALCFSEGRNLPRVQFRRMNPFAPATDITCDPVRQTTS